MRQVRKGNRLLNLGKYVWEKHRQLVLDMEAVKDERRELFVRLAEMTEHRDEWREFAIQLDDDLETEKGGRAFGYPEDRLEWE